MLTSTIRRRGIWNLLKLLKLLKNVKTRWVSLIEPLRRILQEYGVPLAKMKADSVSKEKSTQVKCSFILFVLFCIDFFPCNLQFGLGYGWIMV
jgi:hypothetical protein